MTAPLLQVEQLYREYTLPRESLWGRLPLCRRSMA